MGDLTYASARLCNVGLYERYEYKKLGYESMPDWYEQKRKLKKDIWFKSLPSQTAQDVLQRVEEGFKSYIHNLVLLFPRLNSTLFPILNSIANFHCGISFGNLHKLEISKIKILDKKKVKN